MNLELLYLAIILALLILIITFGDSISPYGWSSFLSTGSNNVSAKSIVATLKV